jgi:hypothetical protein
LELPKLGVVVRARELWLEPEWDPRGTQVSLLLLFFAVEEGNNSRLLLPLVELHCSAA